MGLEVQPGVRPHAMLVEGKLELAAGAELRSWTRPVVSTDVCLINRENNVTMQEILN